MAVVVLARHGRTAANTGGVLAGRAKGVHLDDLGREQARAAAARIAGLPVVEVVTSPLERCRETAKALAASREPALPVRADRGLVEVDYGEWTNRELRTLAKEPMWNVVQTHPAGAAFPGGETMAQMSARAVAAVRRLDAAAAADHGPDAVWVAVSHGDIIKAVLADALGMHLDAFQRIVVNPASLSVVRYTETRPFVLMVNTTEGDLAHLAPPPRKRRRGTRRSTGEAVVGGGAGPGAQ